MIWGDEEDHIVNGNRKLTSTATAPPTTGVVGGAVGGAAATRQRMLPRNAGRMADWPDYEDEAFFQSEEKGGLQNCAFIQYYRKLGFALDTAALFTPLPLTLRVNKSGSSFCKKVLVQIADQLNCSGRKLRGGVADMVGSSACQTNLRWCASQLCAASRAAIAFPPNLGVVEALSIENVPCPEAIGAFLLNAKATGEVPSADDLIVVWSTFVVWCKE